MCVCKTTKNRAHSQSKFEHKISKYNSFHHHLIISQINKWIQLLIWLLNYKINKTTNQTNVLRNEIDSISDLTDSIIETTERPVYTTTDPPRLPKIREKPITTIMTTIMTTTPTTTITTTKTTTEIPSTTVQASR